MGLAAAIWAGLWGAALPVYDPAWTVELQRGAVLGPARVVGMGGAYVSIAEGAGALSLNPAAVAARALYNGDQRFDWDWTLDTDTSLGGLDAENNRLGEIDNHDAGLVSGALSFQIGAFGIGLSIASTTLRLDELDVNAGELTVSTGYNLLEGQLVIGGQMVIGTASVEVQGQQAFRQIGLGLALGGLARPKGEPYRFGFYYRPGYELSALDEVPAGTRFGPVSAPPHFRIPGQLVVGISYALGARGANRIATLGTLPEGVDPEPLPEDRELYVVAADLVYTEASELGTGFEAWARDQLQPIQDVRPSLGFRVGIDSEPIQDRLQVRLGFYWEPTRFFGGQGRTHLTSGFDLRLFEAIWMWRAGMGIDLSRDYSNLILSVGIWH